MRIGNIHNGFDERRRLGGGGTGLLGLEHQHCNAEAYVTFVIWIIIGALAGLLSRVVMQVPNDRGNAVAVAVGIVGAVVVGAIAAVYLGSGVIAINLLLIACGTSGALYTLFGYRCLAMRGR